jgi:hypothetical protein
VRIPKLLAIGAATAIFAAATALLAIPASAQSTPPWEPDPNALGTISFYNAAGDQVTSGTSLSFLFNYAEASTTDPSTPPGTKATLFFAAPTPGEPTGDWPTGQASSSTSFPNASAPAPLNTSPNPVVTLNESQNDADLADFIASHVVQTAAGYANVYQLRVETSAPGSGGTTGTTGDYWDADVQVDPTTGSWIEVYPMEGTVAATTTTTLSASPTGSAQQHATVSLTASVTASDSTHPAGSVQFFQDGFSIGSATLDTTTGTASVSTSTLLPSAPSGTKLTATFTPTDTASYSPSTSAPLAYTVNPVAAVPTISGPHQVGAKETCSEGSLDFGVTASYTWLASGKTIGTGSSLTVPGSAYKKALACRASVRDGSGPTSAATSTSVKVILGKPLKATRKPTLAGPHRVGTTETVRPGTWSQRRVSFTYQWLLNGKPIKKATKSSLKLSKADAGKKISCRVTAHATGYADGVATTASVKVTG